MSDWFGEKSSEIDPCTLTAFGIEISSRYGKMHELTEMMGFCGECARRKVENYVRKVFYDSKAAICTFEIDPAVREDDAVAAAIFAGASETISQFLWFDLVQHGGPLKKFAQEIAADA